ncbi:MAG: acyltransferase family protein [Pseudomonadota bacterium]
MKYRADIDGLRTVAVVLVLVFHFDLFSLGKAGFIGVDVFFVISGFLITTIIRNDLESGRFHLGDFLYRRVRRLYPALLATLLLTMVAGWFLFLPHRYDELAAETLWSLLYVVNIYFWQNVNYFGLQAGSVPLLHMWSLAVEEQFYLFFPLCCIALWRWLPQLLLPVVVLAMLASFALGLIFTPIKPEASFYLLPTRAWELLLGSILALTVHGRTVQGQWLQIMGPVGLALIAASVFLYGPLTLVPGWFALLPTLGAIALILGGFALTAPVTQLMASRPMVWIGKLSYPLYLVHWPIRIFLQEHTLEFTSSWRVLGFFLSFVLAAAIYYLIEMPIRTGRFLSGRRLYLGLVAGMSFSTLAASGMILLHNGLPSRFAPEVTSILAFRKDTPDAFRRCNYMGASIDQICGIGAPEVQREVLVIGDSHALALSGALDLWLSNEKRGGGLVYDHGCMPVMGAGRNRCQNYTESALALAERSTEVTEVVLVSIWRQALPSGGKAFDGRWVPEEQVAEIFSARLQETVARLEAAGKQVTIIEPLFAAARPIPETLASNIAFGRSWPVDTLLVDHRATFSTIYAAFDQVQNTRRVSLIEPFCKGGICRAIIDNRPLFTDNNHLAFSHSERIANSMRE